MIAFCIILGFFGVILFLLGFYFDENGAMFGSLGGAALMATILVFASTQEDKPKAIDVYRDKTTLEITYKDGVPVDSVVVFKDKEK